MSSGDMELWLLILSVIGCLILLTVPTLIFIFPYEYSWLFRVNDVKLVEKIPGPKTLPYFGNILTFNVPHDKLIEVMLKVQHKYGRTFRMWVIGIPGVFLLDPQDVEVVLSSRSHISKSTIYQLLTPWLCEGLLTSDGDKWHSHRKIITPTFHFKILEQYIPIFNTNSNILTELLEKRLNEPWVPINSMIGNCTLDIICETAMGISVHAQKGGNLEYVNAVKRLTNIMVYRLMSPWLYREVLYHLTPAGREQKKLIKMLQNFTEEVIRKRKAEYLQQKNKKPEEPEKKKRLAFLDLLIEVSDQELVLTDSDIREEVDTFMFEGHDTTSVALIWALLMLGSNPRIQEEVVEELKDIFGDSSRDATFEDLQKMAYLERVIKETLRLYPSVPGFGRKLDSDTIIQNYKLPRGTEVLVSPLLIHKNPDVFPNPHEFNPDHFLPERVKNRHPFAYIPFSAGPRNCIGQRFALLEEKVILSSILRKFKVEAVDKPEDIPVMYELIVRPKHDVRLKFSLRE